MSRTYISKSGRVFIDHDISFIKDIKWSIANEHWADIKFEIPETHGSVKGKQIDVVESFTLAFDNVESVVKMINGLLEVANLIHERKKDNHE